MDALAKNFEVQDRTQHQDCLSTLLSQHFHYCWWYICVTGNHFIIVCLITLDAGSIIVKKYKTVRLETATVTLLCSLWTVCALCMRCGRPKKPVWPWPQRLFGFLQLCKAWSVHHQVLTMNFWNGRHEIMASIPPDEGLDQTKTSWKT